MDKVLELFEITKKIPKSDQLLFNKLSFRLGNSRSIAITGRSGSGKTSLLKILAGLDTTYDGTYRFEQEKISQSTTQTLSFRKNNIGLVTQSYHLLEDRTVRANIQLALGTKKDDGKIDELLTIVGLENFGHKKINQISGGEAQRVAIARALVTKPKLLLADEPTGSLDVKTEHEVLTLLEAVKEAGTRLIMVTHSEAVARICDAQYHLEGGKLQLIK